MNKLFYIANIRMPTEKAHGIQIMKTCEVFSKLGFDTELITTKRETLIEDDPFKYYNIEKNFKLTKLWCLDTMGYGWWGFWVESLSFAARLFFYVVFKKGIFYTREEFTAFCLKLSGKSVVWEAHMGQKNIFVRSLIGWQVPIVVISEGLKNLYTQMGVSKDKIMVAHDGVDREQFCLTLTKLEARKKLGIDESKSIAMYTGSRYRWKGVETLERAAELMGNVEVMIVSDKPYLEIPIYLRAADVLVLPNSAVEDISRSYTSPMKLFEYMASGRPIVASDLPSIREILDESSAYFFAPDDPKSLSDAINRCLTSSEEAEAKSAKALNKVKDYTWDKRALRISHFIK